MFRLPRIVNTHTLKACIRQPSYSVKNFQVKQYSIMQNVRKEMFAMPKKSISETKPMGIAKIITLAAFSTTTTPLLFQKPVQCQAATFVNTQQDYNIKENDKIATGYKNTSLIHKGELTFGTFLGICTGFLIKKVGKIFAAFVGTGFVFLQYLSQQGYVTIHWDRLEGGYTNALDLDKNGKVTRRDLQSRWQKLINFLTNNIQFKSSFLVGFYAGIRYG
ncbi:FUN14 family-domain-containing protein [Cokeromyces recurvatus]|uniref:FUN14 family-domain-containing protein n=1 Tax=Cokeromyces recurvatus TaxID=90255 RepID=UPI00222007BB|nr:FUN14 family-domain-containing protein [Cokeromyces recurvatus]KAI7899615.1 FUN14 family-domain-containing protein [Cokeromyces recurvatus]